MLLDAPPWIVERKNPPPGPPNICTLVGPTSHFRGFDDMALAMGKRGWLVFSIGSHRFDEEAIPQGVPAEFHQERNRNLITYRRTHREKIQMSSIVVVIDRADAKKTDTYIGEDSREEIEYAHRHGVPVVYMSVLLDHNSYPVPSERGRVIEKCYCGCDS